MPDYHFKPLFRKFSIKITKNVSINCKVLTCKQHLVANEGKEKKEKLQEQLEGIEVIISYLETSFLHFEVIFRPVLFY